MAESYDSIEEYKKHKQEKHQEMLMKQCVPYSIKVRMSETRIRSFIQECERRNLNCHVSVGGLDSIVLGHLIRKMGCSMCGFGIQLEERPHRFDRLYERNPKEWEFWMTKCCKHDDGTLYGWGEVLDYLSIPWRDPEHWYLNQNGEQLTGQMSIFDMGL